MSKRIFSPTYWGRLRQFEIPHSIIQSGTLRLKPAELAVLLVLLETGKAQQSARPDAQAVQVRATQKLLATRSGYTKNVITDAVKSLALKGFIRICPSRKKQGEYGSNLYILLNPDTGLELEPIGRNFLYRNAVRYIKMPVCVVKQHEAEWSLAKMTSSELRMYVTICWVANGKGRSEFRFEVEQLRTLGGFSTSKTAKAALDGLTDKSLVSVLGDEFHLHDPYTGEPLHVDDDDPASDPANYFVKDVKGRESRWNLNTGTPEHVERLLVECGLEFTPQNSGEYAILCPFHADSNPSCFVNPKKRVFYCFGCQAKGALTKLVMQARRVTKGAALKLMADSAGTTLEFHKPDKNAEAIYSYHDLKGNLVKQVLRYPGKEFKQRRPARGGGWIWNVDGVSPLLYDLNRVADVSVVCIVEGEKDCETIKRLELYTPIGSNVAATTSGNAGSWRDEFADHLKRKRVVLIPDKDQPGDQFRAEVEASLMSRSIEYRVIKLPAAKDVSEFVAKGGTKAALVDLIGRDWIRTTEFEEEHVAPLDEHGNVVTL